MRATFISKFKNLFSHTDLTQGSIWKTILRFALPIFISYMLQNLYSVADAAICGHTLGATEVAGVNDTSSISFIFLQFAFGCTAGMSVIISNRVGRGDMEGARKSFATQIILGIIICAVLTGLSMLCINPLLSLLGVTKSDNPVNNAVYVAAHTYIVIICLGMAAQFFYNMICCVLRSMGDAFTPLVFLMVSTLLNIALDLIFIMCFRMGVAGAAAATIISQAIAAIGCFVFTFLRYKELRLKASDFRAMTLKSSAKTLWQGVPLGLQFSVLAFGIITMSGGVISFDKMPDGSMVDGTPAQIGYSAACKLDNLFMMPFNALGTAMLSFCGQNDGAGQSERIRKGTNQALLMTLILYAFTLCTALPMSINGFYQYIFLSRSSVTSESIRFGNIYLYSAVPFFFPLGLLFVWRNCVQGLGKPLFPFLAGVGELAARIVVCLVLPALVNGAPINCFASNAAFFALGIADASAWIAADLILLAAVIKHIYKKEKSPPQSDDDNVNV